MTIPAQVYDGPQCPHCGAALGAQQLHTGIMTCPHCGRAFEGTVFTPPRREHRAVELAGTGPDESAVCANHARNAAVTSCDRCGLFICSLCELNVGSGSYCPSCFERMRTEGSLGGSATRYRNYAGMATMSLVAGVFCSFLALPLGVLALYYGKKGLRQRREEGRSIAGMIVVMCIAGLEVLAGLGLIGLVIWGMVEGANT